MAYISLMFVFLTIILATLAVFVVIGAVLLTMAARKRKRGESNATMLSVMGGLSLAIPVVIVVGVTIMIVSTVISTMNRYASYDTIKDKWKNERVIEFYAKDEIFNTFFKAADNNDADAIKALFSDEIQQDEDLERQIEEFLDSYPRGISKGTVDERGGMSVGSYDDGNFYNQDYHIVKDDVCYIIEIGACYGNEENPSEVGLHYIKIAVEGYEERLKDGQYIMMIGKMEE